jgi:hypothetical protein
MCEPSDYKGVIVINTLSGVKLYGMTNRLGKISYRQVLDKMYTVLEYSVSNVNKKNLFFSNSETDETEYDLDKIIPVTENKKYVELRLKYVPEMSNEASVK